MKYTNWLKYQLGIFTFFLSFFSAAFFPSMLYAQTPNDKQIFANQLDLVIEAQSIEITAQLTTKSGNKTLAQEEHLEAISWLKNKMMVISVPLTSKAEEGANIQSSGLVRIPFSKRQAQSDFTLNITTDVQLAQAIDILSATKNVKITSYDINYDSNISTDDELTKQITNQILADIRQQAKDTGKPITPRGFSELNVETLEIGRDRLERLLDGKKVKDWNQSEQNITLVKTTKKVSVALTAS